MALGTWDEIRTAYHVARLGTVSGAAEVLGVHHATVIRHIDALEDRLGVKLFQRHARGYTPTEAGQDLLQVAQATDDQFTQLAGRIRGRGDEVTGDLIVTTLPGLAPLLIPALVKFQNAHPELLVRLLTGERLFRMEYGEAHVAIRAGSPPDQPDNVVQPFCRQSGAMYASQGYVDGFGMPREEDNFAGHRFVCHDNDDSRAPFDQWIRAHIPAEQIAFRATEQLVMQAAVRDGAGIGFLPLWEARDHPGLVQVLPPRDEWAAALWLVTHVDLHRTMKVQAFTAFLKEEFEILAGRVNALSDAGRGHLAMLVFSALIAGSFSLGNLVAFDITAPALNAVRFGLASAIMGAIVLLSGGLPRRALQAPWRFAVLGGLFGASLVLMFEALKTATPVSTAAIFTLTPLMTAVVGWFLLRQVTTRRMALALSVGAAGAVWVVFRADLNALLSFDIGPGEAIFFAGAALHAVFTPMLRMLNRGELPVVFTFLFMVSGFVLLTAYSWGDLMATDWSALRPVVWVTFVYLSVFAGSGSFFLLQYGAQVLPSAKVMAYTFLTPTWVIVWEFGLGNGGPPGLVLGGVALTVLALALLLKDEARGL